MKFSSAFALVTMAALVDVAWLAVMVDAAPPTRKPTKKPTRKPTKKPTKKPSTAACPSGWKQASWTGYYSYPPCCPGPYYDPTFPTEECGDYSGCKYQGQFAYVDGTKSLDWVKSHNIVSFFTNQEDNEAFGNKKILISALGKTIEVVAYDTCGDDDCDNCCSKNAKPSGYLIDMEAWTVVNNFGDSFTFVGVNNLQKQICWKLA